MLTRLILVFALAWISTFEVSLLLIRLPNYTFNIFSPSPFKLAGNLSLLEGHYA